jgi:hypothetical protein
MMTTTSDEEDDMKHGETKASRVPPGRYLPANPPGEKIESRHQNSRAMMF